jgi:hypothetical protein
MTERIREFLRRRRDTSSVNNSGAGSALTVDEGQHDGPCLIVDLDVVRENYEAFAKALPDSRVSCCSAFGRSLTKPYAPRTNGKAERFIQTVLHEWADVRAYQLRSAISRVGQLASPLQLALAAW